MPWWGYLAVVAIGACSTTSTMTDATADVDDASRDSGLGDAPLEDTTREDTSEDTFPDAGGDDTSPDTSPALPAVEIGRCLLEDGSDCEGSTEGGTFHLIEPDAEVPLVIGFQGSPMFVFAIRTRGINPGDAELPFSEDNPLVEISVADSDGTPIATYRDYTGLNDAEDGWFERLSFFVVLNRPIEEGDDGADFQVSVFVEDHVGRVLEATQWFRADEQP